MPSKGLGEELAEEEVLVEAELLAEEELSEGQRDPTSASSQKRRNCLPKKNSKRKKSKEKKSKEKKLALKELTQARA